MNSSSVLQEECSSTDPDWLAGLDARNLSQKPKKVLLIGFFGAPNLGDEAVALSAMHCLASAERAEVTVATGNPNVTKRFIGDACQTILGRFGDLELGHFARLILLLRRYDVFLFPGGGILQDVHSNRLLHQSALYAIFACLSEIPYFIVGIGVGPLKTKYAQKLARFVLAYAEQATVRDEVSLKIAREILHEGEKLPEPGCDSALGLFSGNRQEVKTGTIGLAFREWDGLDVASLVRLVSLIRSHGKEAHFLICEEKIDTSFYSEVCKQLDVPVTITNPKTVDEARSEIANYEGLISMRLHPLIFAIQSGIPIAALCYDPKVSELMKAFGLEDCIFSLDAKPEQLLDSIAAHRTVSSEVLSERATAVRAAFLRTLKIVNRRSSRLFIKLHAVSLLLRITIHALAHRLSRKFRKLINKPDGIR